MRSLLQNKAKIAVWDHDQDDPTGKAQRQGLWEDKDYMYVAHKMASIVTCSSSYMYIKEGS